jgi:hypothetical protein
MQIRFFHDFLPEREKKYYAGATFFPARITFFHAGRCSGKKSNSSVKKSNFSVKKSRFGKKNWLCCAVLVTALPSTKLCALARASWAERVRLQVANCMGATQ